MPTDIDAILAQRAELKRRDPECILLFRVEDEIGEWYRAYGDDARAIDVDPIIGGIRFVLSHFSADDRRWIGVAPEDLESLIDRIVKAGKRAAVCEQVKGPAPAGAKVERIVTEGTIGAAHTPDPWRIEESPSDAIISGYEVLSETRDEIALVPLDDVDEDALAETEANARLIAAAPELYAAARAVLDRLDYLRNLWGDEGITRGLADQLRAAITKSEVS